MTDDALRSSQLSVQTAALRVVDLPLSVYRSLPQVCLSAGAKKLVAATALGGVSLLFLARHFQRRRGRKKAPSRQREQEEAGFRFPPPVLPEKDKGGQLTLSLNPKSDDSRSLPPVGRGPSSKLSASLQSLTSVKSVDSSSSWDRPGNDDDVSDAVDTPVTTPENLYLMGMELFEEALRRWEEALMSRCRPAEDEVSCCSSVRLGAADAIAVEMEDVISGEFIHRLESLLRRAYQLQDEFEGTLGSPEASSHSHGSTDNNPDASAREEPDDPSLRDDASLRDDPSLRDTVSVASTDSFVSAAEQSEHRELRSAHTLGPLCHYPFYEEALQLAEDCKISCRVLRTEMLECLGDTDFLAKLHCVRQACQLILCEKATRTFLADTGKKILSSIIVKACKSPKRFEEVFEEMISFLEHTEHWENTELELATRGVKHLNFYDVVLDFILMDSFEDLENPPVSIQNVVNNRWLNSAFKETAVASSCWSVLKQKRQHMKVPDGFIAHFYAVCEQISPVLAWGFLGPRSSLHDFCCFFKDQVLFFLKDIFDLEKVRYSSLETLAEDLLHLLHRRSELLLAYLGAAPQRHLNGCAAPPQAHLLPNALLEAQVQ